VLVAYGKSSGVFRFFGFAQKTKHPTRMEVARGHCPISINFSGLPLCKAGVWGTQSPEESFFCSFFAAKQQKKNRKTGLGLCPKAMKPLG
jgi:hypothetical protein